MPQVQLTHSAHLACLEISWRYHWFPTDFRDLCYTLEKLCKILLSCSVAKKIRKQESRNALFFGPEFETSLEPTFKLLGLRMPPDSLAHWSRKSDVALISPTRGRVLPLEKIQSQKINQSVGCFCYHHLAKLILVSLVGMQTM